jgi:signal transduction histidine kinase
VNAAGAQEAQSRTVEVPIVTGGRVVGSLTVEYPADGLPAPEQDFESSLRWAIVAASIVAVVVALLVGLFVARRLTRPLEQLTVAARRLGAGDLTTRVRDGEGPGEVGELAATFDQMADSLAREDEVRRALVADVTHELRTPVTVLQASLEELVDGTVEPEVERLSSLHDEVLRLTRILQDLQALSAAQAAGLDMHVQPVDLAAVAGEAIERLSGPFASAEIEPRVDLEPAVVLGDPSRLDQVITNLLTNALKFTPAGGEVHVSVSRMNGEARMAVEDTGPGIAPDELDHVFERFWRGGAARSSSGSGVGLAVVAELVRAHHGHVGVESSPGEGARFLVTLPAA